MWKKFFIYMFRWQCSSPILGVFVWLIPNPIVGAIVANLIGACIFFFVDRFIFTSRELDVQWEKKSVGVCCDCGMMGRVYRIAKAPGYDKVKHKNPKYRCGDCADKKAKEIL